MATTSFYVDPSLENEFKTLQLEGKSLAAQGKLRESLRKFELAKLICPAPKVLQRIEKIKEHMKSVGLVVPVDEDASTYEVNCKDHPSKENQSAKNSILSSNRKDSSTKVLSDIQNKKEPKVSRPEELSPFKQYSFDDFKRLAKELAFQGRLEEARNCFKQALKYYDCPKVKRYIQEIEVEIARREIEERSENESLPESKISEISSSVSESVTIKPTGAGSVSETDSNDMLSKSSKYDQTTGGALSVSTKCDPSNLHKESSQSSATSETSSNMSDKDQMDRIKEMYYQARDLASEGHLSEALNLLKKAQDIQYTQKVQKQINKLEEHLSTVNPEEENDGMIKISDDFFVYNEVYNKLYPYQREGVAWMWKLYKMRKGGVLGDDMGLGKTFQAIAFLSGMIDSARIKHVLIIMPVSLIATWENEFKRWCPGISVQSFHGGTKKGREKNLSRVQKRGHVLLTSYGMLVSNVNCLVHCDGIRFVWDYVILDEGHKIKNPTKTTKAVHEISAKNRLVLTGTPIQNNLKELWSLYDFVHHGTLLGSLRTFKGQYENPITRSREKDATIGEKRLGTEMAENLKRIIKPYFLRRTKEEIWGKKDCVDDLENQMGNLKLSVRKNDLILWTHMTTSQIKIYESFLHSDAVKSILMSTRSPLVELTILKKICDHPRLLSKRACQQLGLDGNIEEEELLQKLDDENNMTSTIENVADETLLQESGKLNLVITLLDHLRENGHRTLVFSLSRKILDMIQRILANKNWKVMRLDGTITKREERERRIQKFQNDSRFPVFLITSQVGGVGITLTSADRVIIYDPSWNPATDAQAVDRVYRIGQQKNVVVYRLITCGTVEEKIYRRQIFKDSITRQTTTSTGSSDPYRYFSKQDLRELFTLDDPYTSKTQEQLFVLHSDQWETDDMLEDHISYLKSLNIYGISFHNLMFSKEIKDPTEDNDENGVCYDYIKRQVATAQELIQKETSVVAGGLEASGAFYRPYQEIIPLPKKNYVKDAYKPPVMPEVVDLTEDDHNAYSESPISTPKEKMPPTDVEGVQIGSFSMTTKNDKNSVSFPRENNSENEETSISTASKIRRQSCAKKSIYISDSDTSKTDSCPNSLNNSAAQLVQESCGDSEMSDSSNSLFLSYIPDSVPSTPQISNGNCKRDNKMSLSSTPLKSGDISFMKQKDSVRRITPLKVNRSMTQPDSSFAKALAASPILCYSDSPVTNNEPSANNESVVEDSPIKFYSKKANRLESDSEVSGNESSSKVEAFSSKSYDEDPDDVSDSGNEMEKNERNVKKTKRRELPTSDSEVSGNESSNKVEEFSSKSHGEDPDDVSDSGKKMEKNERDVKKKKRRKLSTSDSEVSGSESSSKVKEFSLKCHGEDPDSDVSESGNRMEKNERNVKKKKRQQLSSSNSEESDLEGSIRDELSTSRDRWKKPSHSGFEESDVSSDGSDSTPSKNHRKSTHFYSGQTSKNGAQESRKLSSLRLDESRDKTKSFGSPEVDDVFEEKAEVSYAHSEHSGALFSGKELSESESDEEYSASELYLSNSENANYTDSEIDYASD